MDALICGIALLHTHVQSSHRGTLAVQTLHGLVDELADLTGSDELRWPRVNMQEQANGAQHIIGYVNRVVGGGGGAIS